MMEFTFEAPAWEAALSSLRSGGVLSAGRFLALMESEPEEELEAALAMLDEKDILLDITDLPAVSSGETAIRLRREKELVKQGKLPQALEENDPLRLYLEEVAAIPVCGDVQLLAEKLLAGDETAATKLTDIMLSRVIESAFSLAGHSVLLLDLIQEGSLGLWQAIMAYAGGDFEAHCNRFVCRTLCCEIVDRYHPRILYFDWWVQHESVKPYMQRFAAYYFNRMEEYGGCVINYKQDGLPFGIGVMDIERGQFAEAKPFPWQSCTSVMRWSWCYSEQPGKAVFKEPSEIICDLVDVVSKNGRLLLNFGPRPDGALREKEIEILQAMAEWMRVNDEAIHGTSIWRAAQEGPTRIQEGQFADGADRGFTSEDFRFTCRGGVIYATCLKCPEDGKLHIKSLCKADASHLFRWHGIIRKVEVLGGGECQWERDNDALHVDMGNFRSDMPVVVKITTD